MVDGERCYTCANPTFQDPRSAKEYAVIGHRHVPDVKYSHKL